MRGVPIPSTFFLAFILTILFLSLKTVLCLQQIDLFRNCVESKGIQKDATIEFSSSPDLYNQLNHQWNTRILKVFPLAYFLPNTTSDVQIAVKCASKFDIPVIPKSGGHSYESLSFGTNDTIVIDFLYMSNTEIDPETSTAVVGPGARLGSINAKLIAAGFGLPLGQCHCVGIGGHVLGGGRGYFAHHYGLALDRVVGMTMVDASGRALNVNETDNPDLFWALRGVGSGLIGIVTCFKFKLFRTEKLKIKFVNVYYSDFRYAEEVLAAWQNWVSWMDENEPTAMSVIDINGFESFSFNARVGIEFRTVYIDDDEHKPNSEYNVFLETIRKMFPPGGEITQVPLTYHGLVIHTGLYNSLQNVSWPDVDLGNLSCEVTPRHVKIKSMYVNKVYPQRELKGLALVIEEMPKMIGSIQLKSEGGVLGVPSNSTAFAHRTDLYSATVWLDGPTNEKELQEGQKFLADFMAQTKFMDTGKSYQNYIDSDLEDYLIRYYAGNLPELVRIKRKWDPNNYFQSLLSIPPEI